MRELKFRCFYRGEMYEVKELSQGIVSSIEMTIDSEFRIVSPDSEHMKGLMQYTGLKDKNGVEIYEGDIITFGRDRNYCVVFQDGAFTLMHHGRLKSSDHPGLKEIDGTPLRWGLISRVKELNFEAEVIGNIYQNPELLNP